jgi:DNA processing protein
MITAEHALEAGRQIFATPGSVTNPLTAVPHELIRDGATLIRDADDLLGDLGLAAPIDEDGEPFVPPGMTPPQQTVWDALVGATPVDVVSARTGLAVSDVIQALVGLELLGLVRQAGGRYERRVSGPGR